VSRNSQMKSCRANNRIHGGYLVFELIRTYRTTGWKIAPLLSQNVLLLDPTTCATERSFYAGFSGEHVGRDRQQDSWRLQPTENKETR
jgi:hypothetical protein